MKWVSCFALTWSLLFSIVLTGTDTDAILEGRLLQKDLARYSWFRDSKDNYTPDSSTVKALLPYARQLRFIVVMGTWCSDSRKHVPPFYKLMKSLHIPERNIELIGVDRNKHSRTVDVAPLHFEYAPTFIVFYKGKEVGRIVENTRVSIEEDLLQMLLNPPA
jgi:hypothetical protein